MKVQLDENTFNAYLNAAINEELEEGIGTKIGQGLTNMGQKILNRTAKKAAPRVVGKTGGRTPVTFGKNIKIAKNSRLSLRDLRRGKVVEFTDKNGTKFYGKKLDNGKIGFFTDPGCEIKADKTLAASGRKQIQNMKAVKLSARRNMAGTALAGTTAALGINALNHKDDPWNAGPGEGANGGNGQGEGENEGWDGTFPWDNTEPRWTPRQPRKTAPVQNQQPARQKMEPLPQVNNPIGQQQAVSNAPGERITATPTLTAKQQAMSNMLSAVRPSAAETSFKNQKQDLNAAYRNARNNPEISKSDRQDLRQLKRDLKRGDQ